MSRYNPQVRSCFGIPIFIQSQGRALRDLISTSSERRVYGTAGTPGVQVKVPLFFRSPSKQSQYPFAILVIWSIAGYEDLFRGNLLDADRLAGPWEFILKIEVLKNHSVASSWFQIWQEIIALEAVCGSQGLSGFSTLKKWLLVAFFITPYLRTVNETLGATNMTPLE